MILRQSGSGEYEEIQQLNLGDKLLITAYVRRVKRSPKLIFLQLLSRGTAFNAVYQNTDEKIPQQGDYIKAFAVVRSEIKAENGLEIRINDFEVVSSSIDTIPSNISEKPNEMSIEEIMANKSAAIKNPYISAIYKLRGSIISTFSRFMEENGFIQITSPIISAFSEKESFLFDYYGENAALSSSPQLYMTAATAALERVFEVTHSFSSKKHNSSRHLNEYTTLNFQIGYINSVSDIIDMVKRYLQYTVQYIRNTCSDVFDMQDITLPNTENIPVLDFYEALELLKKPMQPDTDPLDIKKLCNIAKEKYNSDFIFITSYPADKRPFYIESADGKACCFDLLFRGLKIATGSKNIHDYNEALQKMKLHNIPTEKMSAYTESLRYGTMPYGGFVLGAERLTTSMLGLNDIRWASLFPRDLHHIIP